MKCPHILRKQDTLCYVSVLEKYWHGDSDYRPQQTWFRLETKELRLSGEEMEEGTRVWVGGDSPLFRAPARSHQKEGTNLGPDGRRVGPGGGGGRGAGWGGGGGRLGKGGRGRSWGVGTHEWVPLRSLEQACDPAVIRV